MTARPGTTPPGVHTPGGLGTAPMEKLVVPMRADRVVLLERHAKRFKLSVPELASEILDVWLSEVSP